MLAFGKSIDLRVDYGGPQKDYAEMIKRLGEQRSPEMDAIGWADTTARILLGYTSDISYSYHEGEEQPNRLVFRIKAD